ncbi:hypothetical protein TELCIR_06748 [Teladorsagia circumcincta]|uniref:Uncharacterized protein n=1 Tax=Teladorsagia circumcincta TaxID=45464 RepID=A0A2G9UM71_TELCI|nr:hypothetical protein TELCIR_06748 [Teladorsagia circumcincta]
MQMPSHALNSTPMSTGVVRIDKARVFTVTNDPALNRIKLPRYSQENTPLEIVLLNLTPPLFHGGNNRDKVMILLFYTLFVQEVLSWPDGAPCLHAAYESMNPLEAVEHQGGLQARFS